MISYEKLLKIPLKEIKDIDISMLIEEHGVICLTDFYTKNEIDELNEIYNHLQKFIPIIQKNNEFSKVRQIGSNTIGTYLTHKTDDIILHLRPDGKLRYDISCNKFFKPLPKMIHINNLIENLFKNYNSKCIVDQGIIVSRPKSERGDWHRDNNRRRHTSTLNSIKTELCPRYITILIPLVDFIFENGTPEFIVNSHNDSEINLNKIIKKNENKKTIRDFIDLNSIIIMTGRIVHRGMGNNTNKDRPTIWITYYLE
ncbi:hypothetical protein CPAV1605_1432 [seawater metagenome]|uniref:Phytanoyl-CoA dioxygenase (PhyH) n=1 Tax=seawater metagenome TaxID=1561972 RepID=A0A5E8CKR0_9ZZZZ